MKKIISGILLMISFSSFAIDCDCYAEYKVFEGQYHGDSQYTNHLTFLGSYQNISILDLALAKISCAREVSKAIADASSNLECRR